MKNVKKTVVKKINDIIKNSFSDIKKLLSDNGLYFGSIKDWTNYLDDKDLDNRQRRMSNRITANIADLFSSGYFNGERLSENRLFTMAELEDEYKKVLAEREAKNNIISSDEFQEYLRLHSKYGHLLNLERRHLINFC